jgi:hypothetical protein
MVLHRHVRILFLPNPPIAIFNPIDHVRDSNFPSKTLLLIGWGLHRNHCWTDQVDMSLRHQKT